MSSDIPPFFARVEIGCISYCLKSYYNQSLSNIKSALISGTDEYDQTGFVFDYDTEKGFVDADVG